MKVNYSYTFHQGCLTTVRAVLMAYLLCFVLLPVQAHEARPVSIDIVETSSDRFWVTMKIPNVLPENGLPHLAMPAHCSELDSPVMTRGGSSYLLKASYHCIQGLAEQSLTIAFPKNQASINTLFRVALLSGEKYTHLLSPTERQWKIPVQASILSVARGYTKLGVKHIVAGVDHLLFVACLVFIAGTGKRILITITGFTVAHSLTLFLSALGVVNIAVKPVEAVIALSILFLAHEIVVANKRSWTWRYPIAVSSSFGLLHGFGFAAVLKEVGLPQTELVTALLFFNVGVEVGQLVFIVGLLMLIKFLPLSLNGKMIRQGVGYVIGILASYWFISRMLA